MIALIDYGSGNIQAIGNIYARLKIPFRIASTSDDLLGAERAVLPGVGAFDQAMNELDRSGMRRALDRFAMEQRKPILGICVGMQLLARRSEEGSASGLGWIDGEVIRFDSAKQKAAVRLPHMGWNSVTPTVACELFEGVDLETGYYFLHSYYFSCDDTTNVLARTDYGHSFASAVRRTNVFGVQFHPEKSHAGGIQLLKNFALMPI